jgi:hypothetical protein
MQMKTDKSESLLMVGENYNRVNLKDFDKCIAGDRDKGVVFDNKLCAILK